MTTVNIIVSKVPSYVLMRGTARMHVARVQRGRQLATYSDAWKVPQSFKQTIGARCLVVHGSNTNQAVQKYDETLVDRMCFELQRAGIQPVKLSMKYSVPDSSSLEEAVAMYRRTGSRSVMALGSGAVSDAGKAIRAMVEGQHNKLRTLPYDSRHNSLIISPSDRGSNSSGSASTMAMKSKGVTTVPLISIATTVSPQHSSGSFAFMHSEESYMETRFGRSAEAVVFDTAVLRNCPYYNIDIMRSHSLSRLFDALFASSWRLLVQSYTSAQQGQDPPTGDYMSRAQNDMASLVAKYDSSMDLNVGGAIRSVVEPKRHNYASPNDGECAYMAEALSLVQLAATLQDGEQQQQAVSVNPSSSSLSSSSPPWSPVLLGDRVPRVLEPVASLLFLSDNKPDMLPYSYCAASVFPHMLDSLQETTSGTADLSSQVDLMNTDAMTWQACNIAQSVLADLMRKGDNAQIGASEIDPIEAMRKVADAGAQAVQSMVQNSPKQFKHPAAPSGADSTSSSDSGSGAGLLEKLIFCIQESEEQQMKQQLSPQQQQDQRNILGQGKQTADTSSGGGLGQSRLQVLNSSLVGELVDKVFDEYY